MRRRSGSGVARLNDSFRARDQWVPRRYGRATWPARSSSSRTTSDPSQFSSFPRCGAARKLCNVADVPELCNFILPAVHRQGPIAVAVSTGGASPALAKRLRSEIAELVGPEHAELAEELRAMRPEVRERFATYEERRDYFEEIVEARLG